MWPTFSKVLNDWLIQNVGLEQFVPGQERIEKAFLQFKIKQKKAFPEVIIIGGTNGKGETSWRLTQFLMSYGKKVSLWTSPHIVSVQERFFFNGSFPTEDELLNRFELSKSELEELEIKLSYYEFLFYCFLKMIDTFDLDYLVLEVGLGGRLDTVNQIEPNYSAITSISRDHVEILGPKLKDILYEKYGISRSGKKLVYNLEQTYLRNIIEKWNVEYNVDGIDLHKLGVVTKEHTYQDKNEILASYLCKIILDLNDSLGTIRAKITSFFPLLGRREKVTLGERSFIFIGAHNHDGIREMLRLIAKKEDLKCDGQIFSFSTRPKKEIREFFDLFEKSKCFQGSWNFCPFDHPKAVADEVLSGLVMDWKKGSVFEKRIFYYKNISETLESLPSKGNFLVSGSYYFISSFKSFLS